MTIRPAIIGLGYVGLPIFLRLQEHFSTIGYDINLERTKSLNNQIDYNKEFSKKKLKLKNKSLYTSYLKDLHKCNFYIVTVPTPITKKFKPDLSLIKASCEQLKKVLKKNDIVFFESTVYPTVTETYCKKILEKSGLKSDIDFYLGYSPERINPGDKKRTVDKISKIVAFKNTNRKKDVLKVYKKISKKIIFTKNLLEAETSKIIENIQRDLNIALINEIYKVCKKANINFEKVIDLAKTKWNFVPFKPGLVGGHCLPVDPYYFSYFARKIGLKTKIILAGRNVNNSMYEYIFKNICKEIDLRNINLKKINILYLGLTYKANVADLRNSYALKIYNLLKKRYKRVEAFDPLVSLKKIKKVRMIKKINFKRYNIVILAVPHDDILKIIKNNNLKNYISFFK